MGIRRLDNVAIVVEELDGAIEFFLKLGLLLEGRATIEGDFADQAVGLDGIHSEIAMMSTSDGYGRVELTSYLNPPAVDAPPARQNGIGTHRLMFAVDDIEQSFNDTGAEPIREIATYQDTYRLYYLRGPSGIIVALAQELG